MLFEAYFLLPNQPLRTKLGGAVTRAATSPFAAGPQISSKFRDFYGNPYTPRTNGKVERFDGTLAREWAYIREYDSEQPRRAALVDFLNHYNHDRPHAGIGHQPPISRVPLQTYRLTDTGAAVPPATTSGPEQLAFEITFVEPTS